jgi:hypothetical protein
MKNNKTQEKKACCGCCADCCRSLAECLKKLVAWFEKCCRSKALTS